MEFGDIVYLILMLGFIVFGIFNDSKKKKRKADTSTPPINPEDDRDIRDVFREVFQNSDKPSTPPPAPKKTDRKSSREVVAAIPANKTRPVFQSSMDLVTNFEGESSLKGSMFASELTNKQKEMKVSETFHPILEQLRSKDGQAEMRKAVIYSEILNRKY